MPKLPTILFLTAATCFAQTREVSAKDFGAKGDGLADDTGALQRALDAVCQADSGSPSLHVPAGTYNLRAPLVTGCATFIRGDGATASILLQTVQAPSNHALIANYSLTVEDLAINTAPLAEDLAMIAVFRCGYAPCRGGKPIASTGQTFTFLRFASHGFNFGLGINGTTNSDVIAELTVRDSDISTATALNKVSNPVNAANAAQVTVENSTLSSDGHSDHAIYFIAVRGVLLRNNEIHDFQNSPVKIMTQGYGGGDCPAGAGDYSPWIVQNNRIRHAPAIAIAMYAYCAIRLPRILIAENFLADFPDRYAPDGGAIYIEASCQSRIDDVTLRANTIEDVGLGGVFLLSAQQHAAPCADFKSAGTIANFSSTGDTFTNWSTTAPRQYDTFRASGPNLQHASILGASALGATAAAKSNTFPFAKIDGQ